MPKENWTGEELADINWEIGSCQAFINNTIDELFDPGLEGLGQTKINLLNMLNYEMLSRDMLLRTRDNIERQLFGVR